MENCKGREEGSGKALTSTTGLLVLAAAVLCCCPPPLEGASPPFPVLPATLDIVVEVLY